MFVTVITISFYFSNRCSNLTTIEILVLLSWIPVSKEFWKECLYLGHCSKMYLRKLFSGTHIAYLVTVLTRGRSSQLSSTRLRERKKWWERIFNNFFVNFLYWFKYKWSLICWNVKTNSCLFTNDVKFHQVYSYQIQMSSSYAIFDSLYDYEITFIRPILVR